MKHKDRYLQSHFNEIFIQTITYNGKKNKNNLLTTVCLYENLKTKSSMPLPPDPDPLVEELKRIHLQ